MTTPGNWDELKRIFSEALERPAGARGKFLEQACGDDAELKAAVERLLHQHEKAADFLSTPAVQIAPDESAAAPPRFPPGRTLAGRFRIVRLIGRGGMGEVYEAEDLELGDHVALKTIRADIAADKTVLALFKREIQSARRVTHPNVCRTFDLAQDIDPENGGVTNFLTMELLEGDVLSHRLRTQGPFSPADALPLIEQIAAALQAAHDAGVIHRDFKPGNVILAPGASGTVLRAVITDFGLALPSHRPETEPTDEPAVAGGTPGFMAPEQAAGGPVTPAADVYAFGLVIAEMVGGRRARTAASRLLSRFGGKASRGRTEIRLPGSSAAWTDVLKKCVEPDPDRRYQRPVEVALALRSAGESRLPARLRAAAALAGALLLLAILWQSFAPEGWKILPGRTGPPTGDDLSGSGPQTPAGLRVTPLATLPGHLRNPTLAPDGRHVAFSWGGETGDNEDVYVLDTDDPEHVRRLTTDAAVDDFPVWSPDGTQIAFGRGEGGKGTVFLMSPDGSGERRLTHYDSRFLSWTPDGKTLGVAQREREDEELSIFLVSVADGARRRLVTPPTEVTWAPLLWFSFATDGNMLAFRTRGYGNTVWWLPLRDGRVAGEARRLKEAEETIRSGAWVPGTHQFVFPSDRGGRRALWRVALDRDGGIAERLAGTDDADTVSISAGSPPRLVYTRLLMDQDVWSLQIDEDGQARRSPVKVTRRKSQELLFQLSPDGKRLAFGSGFSAGRSQVWLADVDGSNPLQLTRIPAGAGTARWAPDGRRLTIIIAEAGNWDVWTINADGSGLRRLTTEPSMDSRATWSRDGRWIYFRSNRTGQDRIWKVPAEGGPAEQVTRSDAQEGFEGTDDQLYFFRNTETRTSGRGLEGELWSIPTGGGQESLVLKPVWTLAWALSKRGIYFLDRSQPRRSTDPVPLKLFDPATRQIVQVAVLDGPILGEPWLSASDDGRIVAWTKLGEQRSDLVLIENFQ